MNRTLLCCIFAALLAGCAGFGLSAEQIKELSQSQSSVCVHAPAWNGSAADLHYTFFGGKSTGTAGGGGKSTCGNSVAEFTNEGKLQPPPKVTTTMTTSTPQ